MVGTTADEKSPLTPKTGDDFDMDGTKKCCCFGLFGLLTNYKDIPKSLRIPVGVMRWNLVFSFVIFVLNIVTFCYTVYEDDPYLNPVVCLVFSCIQFPLWMGLDILGNYFLSKAVIYGDKKCYTRFCIEYSCRVLISALGFVGIHYIGLAGLLTVMVLADGSYDSRDWSIVLMSLWIVSLVVLLYAGIHIGVGVKKLGGTDGLLALANSRSSGEMSTSINSKKEKQSGPEVVVSGENIKN